MNVNCVLRELVSVEHRFCQLSKYRGIREAFLSNLASESILFKPTPINGRNWFLQNPDIPGILTWRPVYVEASVGGDLGYTTGPWIYTGPGESPSHGHYVTFWKKQLDVGWKAVLDVGTVHPELETASSHIVFFPNGNPDETWQGSPADSEHARSFLLDCDRSLARESATRGLQEALGAIWSEDIRLYRTGLHPMVGKRVALVTLRHKTEILSLTPADSVLSSAGDLGLSYGLCEFQSHGDNENEQGSYLRAWRNEPRHGWRVVLDLITPIPPDHAINE